MGKVSDQESGPLLRTERGPLGEVESGLAARARLALGKVVE